MLLLHAGYINLSNAIIRGATSDLQPRAGPRSLCVRWQYAAPSAHKVGDGREGGVGGLRIDEQAEGRLQGLAPDGEHVRRVLTHLPPRRGQIRQSRPEASES